MCRARLMMAVLAVLLAIPSPSLQAWDKYGHMVVAYIAYRNLDPQYSAKLAAYVDPLPKYTQLKHTAEDLYADDTVNKLMLAATWPDAIKAFEGHISPVDDSHGAYPKLTEPWHFVDFPFPRPGDATYAGVNQQQAPASPPLNALQVIVEQTQALQAGPGANRAKALCWVEHLAGDLHQPLHCVTLLYDGEFTPPQGDRGGNSIMIHTSDKELHAFWDNLVGKGMDVQKAADTGDQIMRDFPRDQFTAAQLGAGPDAWADESNQVAKDIAYGKILPANGPLVDHALTITPTYRTQAKAAARKRIALAGYRLAVYLQTNLPNP
jgi:hypothetical protein